MFLAVAAFTFGAGVAWRRRRFALAANLTDAKRQEHSGVDGQLGGSWLSDRIWTIDYAAEQFWLDQAAPAAASTDIIPRHLS